MRARVAWVPVWLLGVMVLLTACVSTPQRNQAILDPAALHTIPAGRARCSGRWHRGLQCVHELEPVRPGFIGKTGRTTGCGLPADAIWRRAPAHRIQSRPEAARRGGPGLIQEQLGFAPPLDALRYWLLGLPAPGDAQESRSPGGQLLSLTQQGWLVEYQEYQPQHAAAGTVSLPRRCAQPVKTCAFG